MTERPLPEKLEKARRRMLEKHLAGRDISAAAVLDAMARVGRHEFVSRALVPDAYADRPLRIGKGQTISQPYVVAFMTQALMLAPGMKVLEVGTGSGYQAAVLAEMGVRVFSVERHGDLSRIAEETLGRLGYGDKVVLRVGDGTLGWPEEAPFDRIMVTAAGPGVPESLMGQLADGGFLVMPVGNQGEDQRLVLVEKRGDVAREKALLDVTFVPLVGREGCRGDGLPVKIIGE